MTRRRHEPVVTLRQRVRPRHVDLGPFFDLSLDMMIVVRADLTVVRANSRVTDQLGWTATVLEGTGLADLVHPEDLPAIRAAFALKNRSRRVSIDARFATSAGKWRRLALRVAHDPNSGLLYGLATDITDEYSTLQQWRVQAHTDALTGLHNRAALDARIHELDSSAVPCAVLFADIDDFKDINDSYGHVAGDHVLRILAKRMSGSLRSPDLLCRFGGDEFITLVGGPNPTHRAMAVMDRIITACRAPITVDDLSIPISLSLGVAVSTPDTTAADIVKQADQEMMAAKRRDRSERRPRTGPESECGRRIAAAPIWADSCLGDATVQTVDVDELRVTYTLGMSSPQSARPQTPGGTDDDQ